MQISLLDSQATKRQYEPLKVFGLKKKKKKKKNAWETIKEGISAWCEHGLTSFQVKQKITAINNTHTNKDLHKKKKIRKSHKR